MWSITPGLAPRTAGQASCGTQVEDHVSSPFNTIYNLSPGVTEPIDQQTCTIGSHARSSWVLIFDNSIILKLHDGILPSPRGRGPRGEGE